MERTLKLGVRHCRSQTEHEETVKKALRGMGIKDPKAVHYEVVPGQEWFWPKSYEHEPQYPLRVTVEL